VWAFEIPNQSGNARIIDWLIDWFWEQQTNSEMIDNWRFHGESMNEMIEKSKKRKVSLCKTWYGNGSHSHRVFSGWLIDVHCLGEVGILLFLENQIRVESWSFLWRKKSGCWWEYIGCKKSPDPPGLFHWILNHFLKWCL
jgi:hypothetical protein